MTEETAATADTSAVPITTATSQPHLDFICFTWTMKSGLKEVFLVAHVVIRVSQPKHFLGTAPSDQEERTEKPRSTYTMLISTL